MVLFLTLACVYSHATWEYTPRSAIDAAIPTVAVVAADRRCAEVADALAVDLSLRKDIRVDPDASARLLLNLCRVDIRTEVDVAQLYPGLGAGLTGGVERRDVAIRGIGQAVLTVEIDGEPTMMLHADAHRVRMMREQGAESLVRRSSVHSSVVSDLAEELAQQVAPVSERIRRRWYRNPDPGTARALHNEAVDAERTGDLVNAIRLAHEAMDAHRTLVSAAYVKALELRMADSRYVERSAD